MTQLSRKPVSILAGLQGLLERQLLREGALTEFGELPVTVSVVDVAMKWDEPPSSPVHADTWKESGKVPVSATPCELLYRILEETVGDRWFEEEIEVLAQELHKLGLVLNPGGLNKLLALKILVSSPAERCPFYRDLKAYQWLCRALLGMPGQVDDGVIPTPFQMGVANYVAFELRPGAFSYEVKSFIAAACLHAGHWFLPHALAGAQENVLAISKVSNLGITRERLNAVQVLIEREREDSDTISEEPTKYNEIQALLAIDLEEAISKAIAKADALVDAFTQRAGK